MLKISKTKLTGETCTGESDRQVYLFIYFSQLGCRPGKQESSEGPRYLCR
jgi:hypothetical protein